MAKPSPNSGDAGPIVCRPMGLPITAGCDTARDQTLVCSDASSNAMQCLRPLHHSHQSIVYCSLLSGILTLCPLGHQAADYPTQLSPSSHAPAPHAIIFPISVTPLGSFLRCYWLCFHVGSFVGCGLWGVVVLCIKTLIPWICFPTLSALITPIDVTSVIQKLGKEMFY